MPVRDVAPGPQQVEAAPKPVNRPDPQFDPPPKVDASLKPAFALPLKAEAQPTETKVQADEARQTTAPQAIEAPKDKDDKAPVEGASTTAPSDAEQAWEGKVLARLQRNKRYPAQAQSAGQQDTIMVRMLIDRKGRLIQAAIIRSRGFGLLDNEVLQLAKRAGPYPAPPESVAGDPITLVVPVEFFIKRGR